MRGAKLFFYGWLAICFCAIVPLWMIGWACYVAGDRKRKSDEDEL